MLIMKYLNNIKLSLVAAVFVCTGTVFTGCEDDLTISGSTDKLETVDGVYGYVRSAAGARELTPITLFGDKAGTGHLFFELTKAAEQDVTVTFKIDKDALEAYNEANNTSYEMYPVDKLSLANDGKITVKAGEKKSASMELNINAGGTIGTTYAVAVSATTDGGTTVSTNNQTYIYLVKPQPTYPVRGTARDIKTLCFVEVNNENILNCGEYTMAKDWDSFFCVNWCPVCKTSISDAEVEHEEQDGFFWHINYPVVGEEGRFVEIATTRPETLFGDTAVAVNPDDERYKDIVGKTLKLPMTDREIPVIADAYVDKEFGTGCVKITPAHDPNDFEVGKRHNLEEIVVINDDATMNEKAGKYAGMDRYECRKALVDDLKKEGLLVKVVPHSHNVGVHDRCHTTVEPMIKQQWFVKMDEMIKPAVEGVKNGDIKLLPKRMDKTYFNWTDNIRDWCISRQLWWGHRIPAWYCDDCRSCKVSVSV